MLKIRKSIILKLILTLCVMAQGVATFPHHHHPGSERVCINIFERVNVEAERHTAGMCCCSGAQEDASEAGGDDCSLLDIDAAQPERQLSSAPEVYPFEVMSMVCEVCFACAPQLEAESITEKVRHNPPPLNNYIVYVKAGIGPRAPSFLV